MRIGCSPLRRDLCEELRVIDSPMCACGEGIENAILYFYNCRLYAALCHKFMEEMYKIGRFTISTILYGNKPYEDKKNELYFKLVHDFIKETKRFS